MPSIRVTLSAICCFAICAATLSCNSSRHTQTARSGAAESLTRTQAFAPGGRVNLDINLGNVQVQLASGGDELRLVIQPKRATSSAKMQSWIRQFTVNGSQADVGLQLPNPAHATVTLYVPSSTTLNVKLGVGNLTVDGISGDKNLTLDVGNLTLAGLRSDEYGAASISTDVGNLDDNVFSARKSGMIGKSENAAGRGKFHIRVHLGTGNITLQKASSSGTD